MGIHAWLRQRGFPQTRVRVIYGGSVDVSVAEALLRQPGVDGLFVGRAGLDPPALRGHRADAVVGQSSGHILSDAASSGCCAAASASGRPAITHRWPAGSPSPQRPLPSGDRGRPPGANGDVGPRSATSRGTMPGMQPATRHGQCGGDAVDGIGERAGHPAGTRPGRCAGCRRGGVDHQVRACQSGQRAQQEVRARRRPSANRSIASANAK